jgi:hypothetical protein
MAGVYIGRARGSFCMASLTDGRLVIDAYQVFLGLVIGGLGAVTLAMLGIAVWLFRRNRRLPRLVKGRRR